jgi:hypothetical protein
MPDGERNSRDVKRDPANPTGPERRGSLIPHDVRIRRNVEAEKQLQRPTTGEVTMFPLGEELIKQAEALQKKNNGQQAPPDALKTRSDIQNEPEFNYRAALKSTEEGRELRKLIETAKREVLEEDAETIHRSHE